MIKLRHGVVPALLAVLASTATARGQSGDDSWTEADPPPAGTAQPAPAAPPAAPPGAQPQPYGYPYGAQPYPPPGYGQPGYGAPPSYAPPPEAPRYRYYDESKPIPPGYHVEEQMRRGLVIAGAITVGVPYVLGLSIAAGDDFPNGSGWLLVPVAGPFLTLSAREDRCDNDNDFDLCTEDTVVRTYLVIDGIAQLTGGILFAVGIGTSTKRLARDDVASLAPKVRVAPTQVGRSPGLAVYGAF